jgi:hypothetical protein
MKNIMRMIVVVAVVAGCNGVSIIKLNNQLTELETELIDARNANDADRITAISEDFVTLSTDAESEVAKAKTAVDAISLYRIAATSAWQGGGSNVVLLSANGFDQCEEVGLADAPPRDCFMLRIIPDLAATDEITGRLDKAKADVNAERVKPPAEQSAVVMQQIGSDSDAIFNDFENRFKGLGDAITEFVDIDLPEGLLERATGNQDFIFCRLRDALGVQILSAGMQDSNFLDNQADLETIRMKHDPDNQINCAAN